MKATRDYRIINQQLLYQGKRPQSILILLVTLIFLTRGSDRLVLIYDLVFHPNMLHECNTSIRKP